MSPDRIHILLVDDDSDDCMLFEEVLDDLGLNPIFEKEVDGHKAIERLLNPGANLPDLVFLDLRMPLMTGREFLEKIRAHSLLKALKIIVYSSSLDLDALEDLREIGADHFICKPAAYKELKSVISQAILYGTTAESQISTMNHFVIKP